MKKKLTDEVMFDLIGLAIKNKDWKLKAEDMRRRILEALEKKLEGVK